MGDTTFTGHDQIAIIEFLQRFKIFCYQNGYSGGRAMWLFQFYMKKQAWSLLHIKMQRNNRLVYEDQMEMRQTYLQVFNYLLGAYTTNKVTQEGYAEHFGYHLSSGQTELEYEKSLF